MIKTALLKDLERCYSKEDKNMWLTEYVYDNKTLLQSYKVTLIYKNTANCRRCSNSTEKVSPNYCSFVMVLPCIGRLQ